MKATAVSVRLRIYLCALINTNSDQTQEMAQIGHDAGASDQGVTYAGVNIMGVSREVKCWSDSGVRLVPSDLMCPVQEKPLW